MILRITIALCIISLSSRAQINLTNSKINLIPNWHLGSTYSYFNSYHKITINKKDTITNETTNYDIEFIVVDENETSYSVAWKIKDVTTNTKNGGLKILLSLFKGMNINLNIDRRTGLQGIQNIEKLQDEIGKRALTIKTSEIDQSDGMEFSRLLQKVCSRQEAFEAIIAKHINLFFKFHGMEFEVKKVYESQTQTPSGMTLKTIDTKCQVSLDSIDLSEKVFRLRSTEILDSEQLSETFKDYYMEKNGVSILPDEVRKDLSNISSQLETNSLIDSYGLLITSTFVNRLYLPETSREETLIIKLK